MNLYTTSLPVSQRIKELVGGQESLFYHWTSYFEGFEETRIAIKIRHRIYDMYETHNFTTYGHKQDNYCSAFTLSELPEVLKKVESSGSVKYPIPASKYIHHPNWLHHYLKCCELHALGQNVDDYLMSILQ